MNCSAFTKSGLYDDDGAPLRGAPCRARVRKGRQFCAAHDPAEPDYSAMLRSAAGSFQRLRRARLSGEWTPTATEEALMHFLGRALREVAL